MNITVLCKVVDNFGDIGVVYRLCKQLLFINPGLKINLVIDDLSSFKKINSKINPKLNFQNADGMDIYFWNDAELCHKEFIKNDGEKLCVILECFQCGRPEWMEKILFQEKLNRTVLIIMIDYLTAEKYAEDFHCLKSLTRSAKVQKVNFMPGFTEKTGGLIIDSEWEKPEYNKDGPVLFFTYEKNWSPFVKAVSEWAKDNPFWQNKKSFLLAPGRGKKSFLDAWSSLPKALPLTNLDFMNQNEWDKMMKSSSVLFIRGEESLSRACLSGIPFVWHAYPQSEEYQLVKVNALLERIKIHFSEEEYKLIKNLWIDFNTNDKELDKEKFYNDTKLFLQNAQKLEKGFMDFTLSLRKNGDLASNLMTFILKNAIIS